ncbi:Ribonuclease H [Quillaja saponaria]|uniref:Ribonuclease H n=1 Tax=Quillaja saponaria TaxID=32244 RepID=A0AAD7LWM5_QUISA|nr:Ribonuclease H [Quillaja saponaria]
MKLLAWNCHGIGIPRVVNALHKQCRLEGPNMIFLSETRLRSMEMERIKRRLQFQNRVWSYCSGEGRSGGVAVMCDDIMQVVLLSQSSNHIDFAIQDEHETAIWRGTGICGWPEEVNKHKTIDSLHRISLTSHLPWLCFGDFNAFLSNEEKRGGDPKPFNILERFNDTVQELNLTDLGFSGYPFTWSNGRADSHSIEERLDPYLVIQCWLNKFPSAKVTHLVRFQSDHAPISLTTDNLVRVGRGNKRSFRFEAMWLSHERCSDVTAQAWVLTEYFATLFTSQSASNVDMVTDAGKDRVTTDMNNHLMMEFSREEVVSALNQMHPQKAPGPDGMPALFYQSFWRFVGDDVIRLCMGILNDGTNISFLNHTLIALIPKVKNPVLPKDFRPISLCNVNFKIITKTMANRLKTIILNLISKTQSAFVSGCLIMDNALAAFEVFHFMQKKNKGKNGFMALKLDMAKAYDRIEWDFLKSTILKMGFNNMWVALVMKCVSTITYSLLINGEASEIIQSQRGLRQGDPLSPYLFLLEAEVFSGLLRNAEMASSLSGIKIAPRALFC